MSKPSTTKMLEELGAHYKVPREGRQNPEWSKAVKAAAGREYAAIEVLWDELQKAKQSKPSEHGQSNNQSVVHPVTEVHHGEVSTLPPQTNGETTQVGYAGAMAIHVHAPKPVQAQVIEYPPRDLMGFTATIASRCQTMALGLVVGVLISKPVMKFLGY